jgi:hypothetical protein
MNDLLKEVFSVVESDARWLNDAAQFFEEFVAKLKVQEKAEWDLLAAVYRERAQGIQGEAEKVRASLASVSPSELRLENI